MPGTAATQRSLDRYARLAGLLYLTIIVTSILSLFLVEARLVVEGDPATTTQRIATNQTLFRAGLVYDLAMFASVIALTWALFVILRGIDRNRALLALLWRMAEAIVGAVTVLLGVLVVLLVGSQDAPAGLEPEQLHALVDVLLTARTIGFDVAVFFLSLGTIVYCRLLWISRYVPRPLAGLGIVAFVIMLVGTVVSLLLPQAKDLTMIGWAPGILFEVAIGVWLLLKGIPTATVGRAAPAAMPRPAAESASR
jgi:Domain of unknown function (DUF4386)